MHSLLLGLAAALLLTGCGPEPAPRPESIVVWKPIGAWSGRGDKQTDPFTSAPGRFRGPSRTWQSAWNFLRSFSLQGRRTMSDPDRRAKFFEQVSDRAQGSRPLEANRVQGSHRNRQGSAPCDHRGDPQGAPRQGRCGHRRTLRRGCRRVLAGAAAFHRHEPRGEAGMARHLGRADRARVARSRHQRQRRSRLLPRLPPAGRHPQIGRRPKDRFLDARTVCLPKGCVGGSFTSTLQCPSTWMDPARGLRPSA